jgi:hypothetical protein
MYRKVMFINVHFTRQCDPDMIIHNDVTGKGGVDECITQGKIAAT